MNHQLQKASSNDWPGLYLTEEIEEVLAQAPHLIINVSGGKDSTVMAFMLLMHFKFICPITFIFADTGQEYQDRPGKWDGAETWAIKQTKMFGYNLVTVRHPRLTLYQRVLERGKFPAPQQRWCTSDFKTAPIQKWIRNNVYEPVLINCIGIRAAESRQRAKAEPWSIDEELTKDRCRLTKGPRTCYTWYPIFHWQTDPIYSFIKTHRLPLHPVYKFLPRFSCQVCIYNTGPQLVAINENNPEAIAEVDAVERQLEATTGHKMFMHRDKPIGIRDLITLHRGNEITLYQEPQACLL